MVLIRGMLQCLSHQQFKILTVVHETAHASDLRKLLTHLKIRIILQHRARNRLAEKGVCCGTMISLQHHMCRDVHDAASIEGISNYCRAIPL